MPATDRALVDSFTHRFARDIPPDPPLPDIRRWTVDVMGHFKLFGPASEITVVVSELVTNVYCHAITHTGAPILFNDAGAIGQLILIYDHKTEIFRGEVWDAGGHIMPVQREPEFDPEMMLTRGRGMILVSELTDRNGWYGLDDCKCVWFELDVTPS
jgi:anti-sigma regulatory factor (Ser/Thr protein kinase)